MKKIEIEDLEFDPEKTWKITKEDVKKFKAYVNKWRERFGLYDWWFFTMRNPVDNEDQTVGGAIIDIESRTVNILIKDSWELKPTDSRLELVAFHEVCEVLVEELRDMVRAKKFTEEHLESAIHALIRRLEHVCLNP